MTAHDIYFGRSGGHAVPDGHIPGTTIAWLAGLRESKDAS